ncbi:MAG: TVP38/TMEM64 family protein [Erysipelotrichaceae bacterium]|nr:TVP38/TMEM64 family protein [Erysipelotrichaceae bacterium]
MIIGKRKAIRIIAFVILVAVAVCTVLVSIPLIRFIEEPLKFQEWIMSFGIFSPLVYVLVCVLSIMIPLIPGEPLELAAGYAFGSFNGTIICFLAESLGSIIVILLVKRFGRELIEIFFDKERIESFRFLRTSKARTVLFAVIFIMPGTPKDLLCYLAGISDIDMRLLMVITTLGRLPSVITSSLMGGNLSNHDFRGAIIVFAITAVLSLAGILIYQKIHSEHNKKA